MSEAVSLSAPIVLGSMDARHFDRLLEVVGSYGYGNDENRDVIEFMPVDLTHVIGSNYDRVRKSAIREAVEPFMKLGQDWLDTDGQNMCVSITAGKVTPAAAQRVQNWHQDCFGDPSYRAITTATGLPTEFAVGTLNSKLSEEYGLSLKDRALDMAAFWDKALSWGQLAVEKSCRPYDVIAIDSTHVHRSPINSSTRSIERVFLRIATGKIL